MPPPRNCPATAGTALPPSAWPVAGGRHSAGVMPSTTTPSGWLPTASSPASMPSASSPGPPSSSRNSARAFGQLLERADVGHPAAVQHRDPVGQCQGGPAVRDQHGGTPADQLAQGAEDLGLDPWIDRAGGVVEQHDPRVGEQCPGQRDPLPLAAGQGQAALADHGVVAVRQRLDELVGLDCPRGRPHLVPAGVRAGRRRCWRPPCRRTGSCPRTPCRSARAGRPAATARLRPRRCAANRRARRRSAGSAWPGWTCRSRRRRRWPASRPAGTLQVQSAQHRLGPGVAESDVGEGQCERAVRQRSGIRRRRPRRGRSRSPRAPALRRPAPAGRW